VLEGCNSTVLYCTMYQEPGPIVWQPVSVRVLASRPGALDCFRVCSSTVHLY